MHFTEVAQLAADILEGAGVAALMGGSLLALAFVFQDRGSGGAEIFRNFRHRLGRAIILSLEFLLGADILRTITSEPTLGEIAVLAGIVIIRTFLSFSIDVELEGCWPWQRQRLDLARPKSEAERAPASAGTVREAPT